MVVGRIVGLGVLEAPAAVKAGGEMRITENLVAATAVLLALSAGAAEPLPLSEYEVKWVEKGGRVVSETGEVLHSALVSEYSSGSVLPDEEIALDPEGRLVLDRPARGTVDFYVTCPGYIPRRVGLSLSDGKLSDDIVLYRADGAHPMREFDKTIAFAKEEYDNVCHFDLVKGDFLPPYGYGCVTDAVVSVSGKRVELMMLDHSSDFGAACDIGPRADVPLRNADDVAIDRCFIHNEDMKDSGPFRHASVRPFRVRGHFGYIALDFRSESSYYGDCFVGDLRKGGPCRVVSLWGRVNEKAGERSLLALHGEEPPPKTREDREAPFPGQYAFGVSEDGRSAYFHGLSGENGKVPLPFQRAVYTSCPAKDLKAVETLFLNSVPIPERAFAGMPNLRTVIAKDGFSRLMGSGAFAGCPKLNAVILGNDNNAHPGADVFAGCAKGLTCISLRNVWEKGDDGNWKWKLGSGGYRWEVSVPRNDAKPFLGGDLPVRGAFELPVVRFSAEGIVKELPGGRLYELRYDGSVIRRWK